MSRCPKRTVDQYVDTIDVNTPETGRQAVGIISLRRYYDHDWRDALVPGYQVCGACGRIRKRVNQSPD